MFLSKMERKLKLKNQVKLEAKLQINEKVDRMSFFSQHFLFLV